MLGLVGIIRAGRDTWAWRLTAVALTVALALPYRGRGAWGAIREYDDGVHLASAIDLVHGQLPYRDVVFLQPPGITIVLAPFAALAGLVGQPVAMALARILVIGVALASARLLWGVGRGPWSRRVFVVAFFGLSSDVLVADRTVLLEPFLCLAALGGFRLIDRGGWSDRACIRAGIVFGLGADVKLFGLVVPIACAAALLTRGRPRAAAAHLLAAAVTFGAILLPFLAAAPAATWRDVVVTQIRRPSDGLAGSARLTSVLGLHGWRLGAPQTALVVVVCLTGVAACVAAWRDPVGRAAAIALVLTTGAFAASSSFFDHYGAYALCLLAVVLARLDVPGTWLRRLAVVPLAALLAVEVVGTVSYERQDPDSSSIAAVAAPPGCTFTDSVSLLVAADRFRPATARCPGWIDGRGVALTMLRGRPTDFYPDGFRAVGPWQADVLAQLRQADVLYLVYDPRSSPEWSAPVTAYVLAHFTLRARSTRGSPWEVWTRTG